jgi:phosphoribosylaminoimidazole carboxylase (NCAIR synthetase)
MTDKSICNPEKALSVLLSVLKAADDMGYPNVLKTACGGYDGKGQWVFQEREDVLKLIYKTFRLGEPTEAEIMEVSSYSEEMFRNAATYQ